MRRSPGTAVILYEEDRANPSGDQSLGTAVWRTEPAPSAAGPASGVAIRADVNIPARGIVMRLTLLRNEDKKLPASRLVKIRFTLPPDFPHAGIKGIPAPLMKRSEISRGAALNSIAVQATENSFVVGLLDAKARRNAALLKEWPWFEIPVVYNDGLRALIAIRKGAPGTRAFAKAFSAWKREDGRSLATVP